MRLTSRRVFCAMLLAGCVSGLAQTRSNATVVLDISPQQVSLHEPIYLTLNAQNSGNTPFHLDLGANREANFEITVIDPRGKTTGPIRPQAGELSSVGAVTVAPAQDFRSKLLLTKLYEFVEPGEYRIEAKLNSAVVDATGRTLSPSVQQSFTLNILPLDTKKLAKIASALAEDALTKVSYEERFQAVSALARMHDPIAIPYLKRILTEGKQTRLEAARGLARLGTPEALDALLSAEEAERNGESRTQLRVILRELLSRENDSEARAKIVAALEKP